MHTSYVGFCYYMLSNKNPPQWLRQVAQEVAQEVAQPLVYRLRGYTCTHTCHLSGEPPSPPAMISHLRPPLWCCGCLWCSCCIAATVFAAVQQQLFHCSSAAVLLLPLYCRSVAALLLPCCYSVAVEMLQCCCSAAAVLQLQC